MSASQGRPLPDAYRPRRRGVCLYNAAMDAHEHGLVAMIGWASPMPAAEGCGEGCGCPRIAHAWCIGADGLVVDSSLPEGGHNYCGVPVDTAEALHRSLRSTDPRPWLDELGFSA